jgi:hypothetical protein
MGGTRHDSQQLQIISGEKNLKIGAANPQLEHSRNDHQKLLHHSGGSDQKS